MSAVLQTIHASADDTKQLRALLEAALDKHVPAIPPHQTHPLHHYKRQPLYHHRTREGRQLQSAEPGAIMYLNIGGGGNVRLYLTDNVSYIQYPIHSDLLHVILICRI